MFERILIPLDGSELAEMVLPYGKELACFRMGGGVMQVMFICDKLRTPAR
jgi:nucleotide-binding universal stress UspA family protein